MLERVGVNFPPSSDDVYEEGGRIGEGRQEEKAAGMLPGRQEGREERLAVQIP